MENNAIVKNFKLIEKEHNQLEEDHDHNVTLFAGVLNEHRQKIKELEEKNEKVYNWAKKVTARLDALENPTGPNLRADAWSKDEVAYLKEKLTRVPKLRPLILLMVEEWESKFGVKRSYDSMRKKWARLNK
jgi:hypothetical protein